MKKWKNLLAGLVVLALLLVGCSSVGQTADGSQPEVGGQPIGEAEGSGRLNVHYLDVGQGNAALLESEGHYMLIDGGNRKASSFVVSYLKRQNVESLDYILICLLYTSPSPRD